MSKRQRILVAWVEFPEDACFVRLDVDGETAAKVLSWNNRYVGLMSDDEFDDRDLNAFFFTNTGDFKYPREVGPFPGEEFDAIVMMGCVL